MKVGDDNVPRERDCEACHGNGERDGVICDRCDGSGKRPVEQIPPDTPGF